MEETVLPPWSTTMMEKEQWEVHGVKTKKRHLPHPPTKNIFQLKGVGLSADRNATGRLTKVWSSLGGARVTLEGGGGEGWQSTVLQWQLLCLGLLHIHTQECVTAHMSANTPEMSIKLIASGPAWHPERWIGNKIKVLINCGFRPLSSSGSRGGAYVKALQAGHPAGLPPNNTKNLSRTWKQNV